MKVIYTSEKKIASSVVKAHNHKVVAIAVQLWGTAEGTLMLPAKPSSPQNLPVTPFTYSFTGHHDYYAVANRVTGKRAVSHYVIGVTGRPSAKIRLSSLLRNMRKDFVCTLRHLPRLLVISRSHITSNATLSMLLLLSP